MQQPGGGDGSFLLLPLLLLLRAGSRAELADATQDSGSVCKHIRKGHLWTVLTLKMWKFNGLDRIYASVQAVFKCLAKHAIPIVQLESGDIDRLNNFGVTPDKQIIIQDSNLELSLLRQAWQTEGVEFRLMRASPSFSAANMCLLVLLDIPRRLPDDMYGNSGEVNGTSGTILKILIYIGTSGQFCFQNLF
ncbi:hypothetical protein AAES_05061 [Amazona aestiva]|uniref:Uncharacterized protein n=1 Tax=Amazona aestiva TaxID=12930 RepID=A0A0Q3X8U3_AMAAE|nr:hypothetical protein AAES_05061 [Amazona aestiva]